MALNEEGGGMSYSMPVAPAYGNMGGGFGGFGNDGWWIILLLLCFGGGWGNNGGNWGGNSLYPWLNNSNQINDGFRDQMLGTQISSIGDRVTSGFGDVQTALCGGFAGVNATINGAQSAVTQQLYNGTIADMERSFALQSQLASCCCDNRAGLESVKYTIATENCADRAAISDGIRDVLAATNASTQRILDQMCADKIDQKNDTIAQLRQELMFSRGQASQDVQTAAIRASQATTANQLVNELRTCPIPSMPVYGMTPIFTCANNNGCGCGCGVA